MEGGGGGFGGLTRSNILDPEAQEFHPSMIQTPPPQPQIYVPYPSLPFFDPGFPVVPPPPQAPMAVAAGLPDGTPTRSLVLSQVPVGATEAVVRAEMEAFGGVRAVEMGRAAEGIVTVHFFDQRDAQAALAEIREQHVRQQSRIGQQYCLMMSNWAVPPPPPPPPPPPMGMIVSPFRGMIMGRAVWAQFAPPMSGPNLGSLAVFNLDPSVSSPAFRAMFEVFGDVKELRETKKQQQRFIEFYDIRDAARALGELNGKEINGRRVVVEFSRPAGHLSPSAAAVSRRPFLSPPSSKPTTTATTARPTSQTQNPPRRISQPSDASPSTVTRPGGPSSSLPSPLPPQTQKELKKNAKKQQQQQSSSSSSSNTGKKKSQGSKRASDSRFQFISEGGEGSSEDQTTNCRRDSRTTVMIKNIPNKYRGFDCLTETVVVGDGRCSNKCNVGYGFVNMTSPEATWRLYKAFHRQPWEVFNSRKICEVTYARLQGLEALKEHFKNSKFACDTDEYLPVVFDPPRDGKNLTDPVPIVGGPTGSSTPSDVCEGGGDDDDDDDDTEGDGGDRDVES
ncbi:hypothetical protein QJS04_geneDACA004236 [Acorus gramineus]|uniref:RRM domain-containing protein n=1 Tax=Acorus gramineus TaxID=55184 RepID=A0AAV9B6L7_ACOGR|nr:hypothetical protein QJS04_geneDACA004236 [Acorus gramineus]